MTAPIQLPDAPSALYVIFIVLEYVYVSLRRGIVSVFLRWCLRRFSGESILHHFCQLKMIRNPTQAHIPDSQVVTSNQ